MWEIVVGEVYKHGEQRFTMFGKAIPQTCHLVPDEQIAPGTINRLVKYAVECAKEVGLDVLFKDDEFNIVVSTNDYDEKPTERIYHVSFINEKRLEISIQGILIDRYCRVIVEHGWNIQILP